MTMRFPIQFNIRLKQEVSDPQIRKEIRQYISNTKSTFTEYNKKLSKEYIPQYIRPELWRDNIYVKYTSYRNRIENYLDTGIVQEVDNLYVDIKNDLSIIGISIDDDIARAIRDGEDYERLSDLLGTLTRYLEEGAFSINYEIAINDIRNEIISIVSKYI